MKKIILALVAGAWASWHGAHASDGGIAWDKAPNKTNDMAALQNGAKLFVNYCLNCHSAAFMRFNRLKDIGLTEQQIKDNLLFTTDKVGETMKAAIDPKQAKEWFGANPPDLTVIARSRAGAGGHRCGLPLHLHAHLLPGRDQADRLEQPGIPQCRHAPRACGSCRASAGPCLKPREHGHEVQVFKGWEQVTPGTMTPLQYDQAVGDLVSYLQWMGEPAQNTRVRVGVWVLLFLCVFTVFAWRLNAAFWKDIK